MKDSGEYWAIKIIRDSHVATLLRMTEVEDPHVALLATVIPNSLATINVSEMMADQTCHSDRASTGKRRGISLVNLRAK